MDTQRLLESLNADIIKKDIPQMSVGDSVNVHQRIVEGDKERIQVFSGVLISRSDRGVNEMIVVRRVVEGTGVERDGNGGGGAPALRTQREDPRPAPRRRRGRSGRGRIAHVSTETRSSAKQWSAWRLRRCQCIFGFDRNRIP